MAVGKWTVESEADCGEIKKRDECRQFEIVPGRKANSINETTYYESSII